MKSTINPFSVRTNSPGYVGSRFAKKASDDDIIQMVELKNEHAIVYNSKLLPIKQRIALLNKKYKIYKRG